jgi:Cell wall-active antibiotics response 4TMS YvqF
MTNPETTQSPRSTTIVPLGGVRLAGRLRLPRRLVHIALLGGMDLDLSQAELAGVQLDIVKVSLIGGVQLVVPADVRVEVQGFVLLGGKDIERRPESAGSDRIVRVRAFGLVGGVRVRVAG